MPKGAGLSKRAPDRAGPPAPRELPILPDQAPASPAHVYALGLLPASVLPDHDPFAVGRPTKYVRRHILRLLQALCDGHYLTHACRLAGLTTEAVSEWGRLERDGDPRYLGFSDSLHHAEAYALDFALGSWRGHFDKDFRAPRDFMARRAKDHWAPEAHIVTEGQAPQVHIAVVQPSDLLPMLGVLQQAGALPSGEAIAQSLETIDGEVISQDRLGPTESHTDAIESTEVDL